MVTRTRLWTPSIRFSEIAGVYRSILEILDRIDGQLTTRTDDDTGVVTVISDSNDGHGITTSSTVDVYWQSGQRIGMSVSAVTNKAVTVDGGAGDALPTLNDWVWVKVQGAGGTIFPLGDHIHGALTGSTLTTIGEQQATVTASEAWNKWGKPAGRFVGILPFLDFNGTDEDADTPDISYFTFGDGTNDAPFSVGALHSPRATAGDAARTILAKWSTSSREWALESSAANDRYQLRIGDESADVVAGRDSAVNSTPDNIWSFILGTYNGVGGASSGDGVTTYVNGASSDGGAFNDASYVAMENLGSVIVVGRQFASSTWMLGGISISFIVPRELTADNTKMLDHVIRGAAGLT